MFYYSHPQPGMCAPGPSHVLLIETKTPVQCSAVRPCASLHIASLISNIGNSIAFELVTM